MGQRVFSKQVIIFYQLHREWKIEIQVFIHLSVVDSSDRPVYTYAFDVLLRVFNIRLRQYVTSTLITVLSCRWFSVPSFAFHWHSVPHFYFQLTMTTIFIFGKRRFSLCLTACQIVAPKGTRNRWKIWGLQSCACKFNTKEEKWANKCEAVLRTRKTTMTHGGFFFMLGSQPPCNEQKAAQRLCCTFGRPAESYKVV